MDKESAGTRKALSSIRPVASPARRLSLRVLHAIDAKAAFANLALDEALEESSLTPPDRALATELVYGVTRLRLRLDYVLDRLSTRPVAELPAWIRNTLRLGLYQLMFLERIPARAAVSECVSLAWEFGHKGTAGFVNAVLRQAARRAGSLAAELPPPAPGLGGSGLAYRLAIEYSHPEWMVRRWLDRDGEETTRRRLLVDNEPAPLCLRANALRTGREELLARLEREGAEAVPGRLCPEAVVYRSGPSIRDLPSYREGLFTVQDEGAMLAARQLDPQPDWFVIDACAGAGGKATHLAELMGDRGKILAIDPHTHKLSLLRGTARRLGLSSIVVRPLDARELPGSGLRQAADAVLVDAPCSGLGVLRRRPDLRWRMREEDLLSLAALQAGIVSAAASCVRPGGILVYTTCTTEPEENEEIVEGFLASNLEFTRDTRRPAAGLESFAESRPASGGDLKLAAESGGHDGFYVARLLRRPPLRAEPDFAEPDLERKQ